MAPQRPSEVRVVPSIGSTATSVSIGVPSPTTSPLNSIGASSFSPSPMTTSPSIGTLSSTTRMASTAAPSAPFLSPRPIQRLAASAAASVVRTSSSARFRSGRCRCVMGSKPSAPPGALSPSPAWEADRMGVWTPRGNEDDEPEGVQLSGLEHLEGPTGDDGEEITFELDEWSEADRALLADRLTTLGAPHSWEGTTLVVADEDEAWVERIMDQVDEELATADAAGDDDDDESVAYDLAEWDDDSCVALLEALSADTIPYALDGNE